MKSCASGQVPGVYIVRVFFVVRYTKYHKLFQQIKENGETLPAPHPPSQYRFFSLMHTPSTFNIPHLPSDLT